MLDAFWWAVAPSALAGAGLCLLLERLLRPPVRPFWKRAPAALAIHLGVWLGLFTCLLLVLQRPFFAASALLAGMLFLVLVSNAKYHALREPFIFQDFEYFSDVFRHPRLYLPFLGAGKAALAVLAFGGAVYAGLALEESLLSVLPADDFLAGSVILALAAVVLLWWAARSKLAVTFEAAGDLCRLGLLCAMWRYGEEELRPCRRHWPFDGASPGSAKPTNATNATSDEPAHLVVVQSESFFDPRRLYAGIRGEVLREFDALQAEALCCGPLEVAAWGANTVRTEFAFLSGLAGESLGVHRFNPYRRLARQGVATLASFLQRRGYRTICVHPYAASFYDRHKVFPCLGFDEFIDIRSFAGAAKSGPYVGDLALAEKVCSLLQKAGGQPLFVFVISMENHGPLHLERVEPEEEERFYSRPPPTGCDDLTIYLRHLRNADRMAGMLRAELEGLPGSGGLCWFGDHVPIMPDVYRTLGAPAGQTDYFIWRKNEPGGPERQQAGQSLRHAMKVENLASLFLEEMGLLAPQSLPSSSAKAATVC
ncbi:sulfatase-like hydrolase/transferase [Accumulibacter sp.]|uniref:LTA synthase family protein n=1 Tax=Accumulibacter sp. TaxID=2053492 RepID=UPI0004B8B26F|nr:sulfatase-like hydrolase/transferase [Accumulibacter sp.]HRF02962.1 LTA synthase family protein [Accumulibacter sp.]